MNIRVKNGPKIIHKFFLFIEFERSARFFNVKLTYSLSLTRRHLIKSLASSDMSENASWSKSYLAIVTLAIVSTSVSPMNGDNPDNLLYQRDYKFIITYKLSPINLKLCISYRSLNSRIEFSFMI